MKALLSKSRILNHITFWLGYFLLFGFIWARNGNYADAYFLEFILLPIRMGVVYTVLYVLLPKYLLTKRFLLFVCVYVGLLLVGSVLQRFCIHFFYDQQTSFDLAQLLDLSAILRAFVLINSTTLLLLAVKILFLYFEERATNQPIYDEKIEVKSDKRFYSIHPSEILYLEGLGNYVTYHLKSGRKIIGYNSLKKANEELPDCFIRIHKSFIVNAPTVISYDKTSVEILPDKFLPIGNAYEFEVKYPNNHR